MPTNTQSKWQEPIKVLALTLALTGLTSTTAQAVGTDEELTTREVSVEVASAVVDAGAPASTGAAEVKDSTAGVSTVIPDTTTSMTIPGADVTGTTSSSTVVSGAGSSQAAVQEVGEDGKRVAFIVNSASDPTNYTLKFAGASALTQAEDGSIMVLDAEGNVDAVIAKPWAKDANGTDVPTSYEINGTNLTQVVDHRTGAFTYPVTADPWARHWWGISIYLNRSQTNNVMFGSAAAIAPSLYIPEPAVSKAVAAALAVFSGYANWIYNRGGCLAMHRSWSGQAWVWHYYGGSCR